MDIPGVICRLLAVAGLAFAAGASAGDKSQMMDTNGDGMISAAEHEAGARAMFARMDANHDGTVTADEFDAMHAQMAPDGAGRARISAADMIKAFDTDGNGDISAAEHEAGSRAMFTKMDANGDGNLSAAERQAGRDSRMQLDRG